MKKNNVIPAILLLAFVVLILSACNKDSENSTSSYNIRMTDSPGPYSEVNIDLQGVEITGTGGRTLVMNINKGIYNLVDFSNGKDTLIATDTLEVTTVQQIRLILGTNNTVVVDGVIHPLSTPSADQSGLKLQVHQVLQAGVQYSILLDFDANQSIVADGTGNYKLKPVIRTIDDALSGALKGKITPAGTLAFVTAASDISYSTNVSASGYFMIIGLPPGTYSVNVTPASPLIQVSQSNVVIIKGVTTDLGTISFN